MRYLKPAFILILIICGIIFSKFFLNAQEGVPLEQQILQKLNILIDGQAKNYDLLNKVLTNQEEIKKELEVIKVRATVH